MAHLAGQFAGIVHVEVDPHQADTLVEALRQLDGQGLTVIVQKDSDIRAGRLPSRRLLLDVMGNDRPGIVHEVSRVLADRQVNVEEFLTECVSAPMSGGKLFRATARLRLPAGLTRTAVAARAGTNRPRPDGGYPTACGRLDPRERMSDTARSRGFAALENR